MTRAQIHVEPSATESFIEKYQHRPQYTFEFEWRKNSAKNARDGKLGPNRKKKGFLPTKAFSFPGGLSATDVLFDSPIKNLSSEFNLVYLYTSPLHQHAGCPLQAATRQHPSEIETGPAKHHVIYFQERSHNRQNAEKFLHCFGSVSADMCPQR
jgi:hypothetical protein